MNNVGANRYIAPAMALLAVIIAWVSPVLNISMQGVSQSFNLQELLDADALHMRWVIISGIGVLVLLASAFLGDTMRKKVAQIGAYLAVVLPVRVLFDIFFDEDLDGVSAGWGLWAGLVLTVLAIVVTHMMPDDADPVVRTPRTQE